MKNKFLLIVMACFLFGSVQARNLGPGSLQQGDMYEWVTAVKNSLLNSAKNPAGLAIGSVSTNIKTQTTVNYTIDGVFYQFVPSSNIYTYTTSNCGAQAINTYRKYMVCLNSSGAVKIVGGNSSTWNNAKLPSLPTGNAAIGYFKVKAPIASWTLGQAGVSTLNTTAVVYKNIAAIESGYSSVRENNNSYVSDDTSDSALKW